MAEKRFRVTKEEFLALQQLKAQQSDIAKKQNQYNQTVQMENNEVQIKCKEREIKFKKDELSSGKIIEKHLEFTDDKKPKHMIQGEIDILTQQIKELKRQNKLISDMLENKDG